MLCAGTTALPWEPYTGGQAAPSPYYPQEIASTDVTEVTVTGENQSKAAAITLAKRSSMYCICQKRWCAKLIAGL